MIDVDAGVGSHIFNLSMKHRPYMYEVLGGRVKPWEMTMEERAAYAAEHLAKQQGQAQRPEEDK